jgi:hypothetical protein
MAKMSFAEIREHQKHHPEDNLCDLHHPRDNHLMFFTQEGMKRFWQIARRGMKSLGPERRKYNLNSVISAIQKLFLIRLLDSPSSNDEQAHEIFLQVIRALSRIQMIGIGRATRQLPVFSSRSQMRLIVSETPVSLPPPWPARLARECTHERYRQPLGMGKDELQMSRDAVSPLHSNAGCLLNVARLIA